MIVRRLSAIVLKVETKVLIALTAAITLLILLNVVTRSAGMALFWVDEAAIYTMIWAVMVGASMQLRLGLAISVDLVPHMLGEKGRKTLSLVVDILVLVFALALVWLSWIWFDPVGIALAGFDASAFSGTTFNFIYQEPTVTVGIPKFYIWLIMPILGVTLSIHAMANIADALAGRARPSLAGLRDD
ncbi:MAG: TRAP transporter small permease subunit [Devosia sp.]